MTTEIPEFAEPISAPGAESLFSTPDHTQSRKVPPGVKKAFGKLGNNKSTRGGPRQLRQEDVNRLADYYDTLAWAIQLYKPAVADAINELVKVGENEDETPITKPRAEICAEAWGELAKENDRVRRAILFMVETGAWSKVMMANLPILVAALPDDALSRVMATILPTPATDETVVDWSAN